MSLRRSSRVSTRPSVSTQTPPITTANTSKKRTSSHAVANQSVVKKVKKSDTTKSSEPGSEPFKIPEVPATPNKRRSTTKATKIPPLTPTPSLVKVLRGRYSSGDGENATPTSPPPQEDRPVAPHMTNAPLVTPGGTRTLAYPDINTDSSSPSKAASRNINRPVATTGTLLDKACAHLTQVDPRMKPLIEKHRCDVFSPKGLAEDVDPFESLSSGIISQQVSGAAAASIKNKFVALFQGDASANGSDRQPVTAKFPTPAQVAGTSIEKLRTAGLSQRKAEYIQGLAQKFVTGELTNAMLMKATDDEVMEKLIAVRGLGKWSVEMFACFGLKRLDILSTGDLGVQRGMAHFFGKDVAKLKAKGGGKWKYMSEQDMLDKSAPFAPYRSLFMWYMWRVEDVNVSAMQVA